MRVRRPIDGRDWRRQLTAARLCRIPQDDEFCNASPRAARVSKQPHRVDTVADALQRIRASEQVGAQRRRKGEARRLRAR